MKNTLFSICVVILAIIICTSLMLILPIWLITNVGVIAGCVVFLFVLFLFGTIFKN